MVNGEQDLPAAEAFHHIGAYKPKFIAAVIKGAGSRSGVSSQIGIAFFLALFGTF
jgi:hypothetical protein